MNEELEQFIKGKWIGNGLHRCVYEYALNKEYVIKISCSEWGRENNMIENRVWYEVQDTPWEKWFAPILAISEAGKYLIMKKAELGKQRDYPKRIPTFFTDLKYSNFGWIDGQFVSVDYANFRITDTLSSKEKKANWWNI